MNTAQRNQAVIMLVETVQPVVDSINADKMPTTRNAYGRYMAVLTPFDSQLRSLVADACIAAGANAQGVRDALRALTGG